MKNYNVTYTESENVEKTIEVEAENIFNLVIELETKLLYREQFESISNITLIK